jgi:hypothetical protein
METSVQIVQRWVILVTMPFKSTEQHDADPVNSISTRSIRPTPFGAVWSIRKPSHQIINQLKDILKTLAGVAAALGLRYDPQPSRIFARWNLPGCF